MTNKTMTTIYVVNGEQLALMGETIAKSVVDMLKEMEEAKKPRYISRKEVAELLGVTLPSIHNYVNQGLLKPCYIGGKPRFNATEIEQSMREGKIGRYMHNKKGGVSC